MKRRWIFGLEVRNSDTGILITNKVDSVSSEIELKKEFF